jgi:N-acetylmuramoyl-L-alanine amidase
MLKGFLYLSVFLLVLAPLHGHSEYMALNDLLEETGARLEWDPLAERGRIRLGDAVVVFKMDSPFVIFDYGEVYFSDPFTRKEGAIFLPTETVDHIKGYFASDADRGDTPRVAVIFVDPGHGGDDPGTLSSYALKSGDVVVQEKDIVLDISLRLEKLLADTYPAKTILLSRDSDTFIELEERAQMANGITLKDNEAILFLSIHANAAFKKSTKGFEVWVLPPEYERELVDEADIDETTKDILPILNSMREVEFATESIILAQEILKSLDERVGDVTLNRGLKEEEWFVVRNSKMPAVLIEVGFVSNRDEAFLMRDSAYLQKLAEGIYNGVSRFVAQFESSQGFTE